jgi:DNA-binding LytR/AlgR family response regulator
MKKILIVEDDVLISEHLKMIVEDLNYDVIDICSSLKSALKSLKSKTPDIAFLDIRMNGIDEGIEVAKELKKLEIPFIFITSFSDKKTLLAAVAQQPVGYIVKPYNKEDVVLTLNTAMQSFEEQFIYIGSVRSKERVRIKDIKWLMSENVYVELQTDNQKYICRAKLNDIHSLLPKHFLRVNQSYVINSQLVKSIKTDVVILDDIEISLSKKYRKEFLSNFSDLS